ncbi:MULTISPECIES: flavodoxin domain-containing protein [Rhodococcus]|uniref:Flavodoxin domain-containing protein n=1 Tax=Rhodococcus oxybenzonivorans TaxID=1990687 RepID=A0AAE5A943_9NOCA|nr:MULTISPECIES: flavodoxin domain-containing protein [Rhodococcus]MDV7245189.1 flavodoxin domain-containing protein [Rhodococcus oxybenzonivorans]MDV7267459.1 flavodoxin domain-containing protein [Rhodococcus oxybenzonivorans]MDV7272529.1 flavodoxin domain-containing protein [Rhodococcus oxybenzonivorans]MDV7336214.1 flavodoxin domain-containing protein [Rhodococcus oxybenzonivorans]MDV7342899.1 flavodoxin domain-containing protein [Rhodococcus oxybenzonivorans]
MAVVILYGSEGGTAELVADHLADVLGAYDDTSLYDMMEYDAGDLDPENFHVIVCSTYGEGELPTGAEPFFEGLDEDEPDLNGLRFALFGLGDKVYEDTYNRGGEILAEKLVSLGAVQVGEHGRHDGSSSIRPKDQAEEWAKIIGEEFLG